MLFRSGTFISESVLSALVDGRWLLTDETRGTLLENHVKTEQWTLLIHKAHILDLAFGTGPYSDDFLTWGAGKATGIDISP